MVGAFHWRLLGQIVGTLACLSHGLTDICGWRPIILSRSAHPQPLEYEQFRLLVDISRIQRPLAIATRLLYGLRLRSRCSTGISFLGTLVAETSRASIEVDRKGLRERPSPLERRRKDRVTLWLRSSLLREAPRT